MVEPHSGGERLAERAGLDRFQPSVLIRYGAGSMDENWSLILHGKGNVARVLKSFAMPSRDVRVAQRASAHDGTAPLTGDYHAAVSRLTRYGLIGWSH